MSAGAAGRITEPSLGADEGAVLYVRRARGFGPAQCSPASGLLDAIPTQVKFCSLEWSFIPGVPLRVVHQTIRKQSKLVCLWGSGRHPTSYAHSHGQRPLRYLQIMSLCAPPHRLGTTCGDPATEQLPTRARVVN
jgi:hypothetical protein